VFLLMVSEASGGSGAERASLLHRTREFPPRAGLGVIRSRSTGGGYRVILLQSSTPSRLPLRAVPSSWGGWYVKRGEEGRRADAHLPRRLPRLFCGAVTRDIETSAAH
jgi:hypothetical protein